MKYLLFIYFFISCNALEVLTDAKSKIDPGFEQNNQSLHNSLIAFWRFEEAAVGDKFDTNGTNALQIQGNSNPPLFTGAVGNALNCSSSTGVPSLPTLLSSFPLNISNTGSYSIALWVLPSSSMSAVAVSKLIEFKVAGSITGFIGLKNTSGATASPTEINFEFSPNNTVIPHSFTSANFTHVVFNINRTNNSIVTFINGSMFHSASIGNTNILSTDAFSFCSSFDSGSTFGKFNGLLDSFGLWNRLLEPSEISSLYNKSSGLD